MELEKNLYEREGYVFVGWNTKKQMVQEILIHIIQKQVNLKVHLEVPAHDVTLYAQWALNMVTINAAPTIKAEDKVVTVGDKFIQWQV